MFTKILKQVNLLYIISEKIKNVHLLLQWLYIITQKRQIFTETHQSSAPRLGYLDGYQISLS